MNEKFWFFHRNADGMTVKYTISGKGDVLGQLKAVNQAGDTILVYKADITRVGCSPLCRAYVDGFLLGCLPEPPVFHDDYVDRTYAELAQMKEEQDKERLKHQEKVDNFLIVGKW